MAKFCGFIQSGSSSGFRLLVIGGPPVACSPHKFIRPRFDG